MVSTCVQHAVVYAGAQKNVGCAGVTVVIGMLIQLPCSTWFLSVITSLMLCGSVVYSER